MADAEGVAVKEATEMTDDDLDAAVARECFGWHEKGGPYNFWWVDSEGVRQIDSSSGNRITDIWDPTTDARDAERVWDWLVTKSKIDGLGEVSVTRESVEWPWKRSLCLAALRVARSKA